jgi:hypothetical protein
MTDNLRVFLASPGDVPQEREALPRVVDEFNVTIGPLSDCRLEAIRWETHATPDAGRAQAVLNDQLSDYDIFIGIMWRRFGTPTGVAGSGTEEEYRIAFQRWRTNPELVLMFYFCEAPFYPRSVDELEQMKHVLSFRRELEGQALTWTYDTSIIFEAEIRKHLSVRIPRLLQDKRTTPRSRAKPIDESVRALVDLWDRMSPDLQRAFNVAYNENRLAGDPGIQTRDLFAALLRVNSPSLQQIVNEIPAAALPPPTPGTVINTTYIVEERPWLSGCVASSVKRLSRALSHDRQLPPRMFLQISRKMEPVARSHCSESTTLALPRLIAYSGRREFRLLAVEEASNFACN